MRVSFWLIGALLVWLAAGIVLTLFPETDTAIYQMNRRLILDWLLTAKDRPAWLAAWFLVLCLLNFFLVVNLVCCIGVTLWKRLFLNDKWKNSLLVVLHIMVIGILAGHLANMGIGFKQEGIKLLPGTSVHLPEGYCLHLASVNFTADTAILKKQGKSARHEMNRDRFKIAENYIRITLTRHGRPVADGPVHLLSPLKTGDLRITLRRFFLAENHPDQPVGAIVTAAKNPIHEVFFLTYALMIFCLLLYILAVSHNLKRRIP